MADMQELNESMIVNEETAGDEPVETYEAPEAVAVDGAALKKPRAKRVSVKSVEGKVAALEQQVETLAQELARLTSMTEQLAHLSGKIASLEESLAARSSSGADGDGAGIAEQVRQLDERMQKLAYVLAQQNWNRV